MYELNQNRKDFQNRLQRFAGAGRRSVRAQGPFSSHGAVRMVTGCLLHPRTRSCIFATAIASMTAVSRKEAARDAHAPVVLQRFGLAQGIPLELSEDRGSVHVEIPGHFRDGAAGIERLAEQFLLHVGQDVGKGPVHRLVGRR